MEIRVNNLSVCYDVRHRIFGHDVVKALTDVSFTIHSGERVAILGPNGSGKTTLLRALCNLIPISAGHIAFGGMPTVGKEPSVLPVRLAEGGGLYPQFDVAKNIVYHLELRGVPRSECAHRLLEAAGQVSIFNLLRRRIEELSEGERQRVIMARMLVSVPEKPVLLFDEPFAHIDEPSREGLITLFMSVFDRQDVTAVYITHSRREALDICESGGKVLLLNKGHVEQFATIGEIIEKPSTKFVESFFTHWVRREQQAFGRFNDVEKIVTLSASKFPRKGGVS